MWISKKQLNKIQETIFENIEDCFNKRLEQYFNDYLDKKIKEMVTDHYIEGSDVMHRYSYYLRDSIESITKEILCGYDKHFSNIVAEKWTTDYISHVCEQMIIEEFSKRYADIAQGVSKEIAEKLWNKC